MPTNLLKEWAELEHGQIHSHDLHDGQMTVRRVPFGYAWSLRLYANYGALRGGFAWTPRATLRKLEHEIRTARHLAGTAFLHR
ncbi:MAG: hypothetical protein EOP24_00765 [Hyphomicrobiales bacterium]|nr:MAG: hypothetical protein EOP24_00765 [Hyphomicrobiales bacterium]